MKNISTNLTFLSLRSFNLKKVSCVLWRVRPHIKINKNTNVNQNTFHRMHIQLHTYVYDSLGIKKKMSFKRNTNLYGYSNILIYILSS